MGGQPRQERERPEGSSERPETTLTSCPHAHLKDGSVDSLPVVGWVAVHSGEFVNGHRGAVAVDGARALDVQADEPRAVVAALALSLHVDDHLQSDAAIQRGERAAGDVVSQPRVGHVDEADEERGEERVHAAWWGHA